jgi:hypothetical protein
MNDRTDRGSCEHRDGREIPRRVGAVQKEVMRLVSRRAATQSAHHLLVREYLERNDYGGDDGQRD